MGNLKLTVVALVLAVLLVNIDQAFAAVDFTPFIADGLNILQIAAVVIAGVLSKFVVSWLSATTGVRNAEMEAILANQANDILHKAIDMAFATMLAKVNDPDNPLKKVEFDNVFITMAVQYAMRSMPGIIAKFGLTEARIRDMIIARLPTYMIDGTRLTSPAATLAEANAQLAVDAAQ